MKIEIIANAEITKNRKYIETIIDLVKKYGHSYHIASVVQDNYGNYTYEANAKSDIIITLGGDGTVLQAVQNAILYDIPILPINTGTLGFLANFKLKHIENLLARDKKIDIEERTLLEVYKDGKLIDIALNDVVIARDGFSRIVSLETVVGKETVNEYRGDGLVVSTATGSTGYNLSLGGPIMSPKCENIILTPIACHSLLSRSIILDSKEEVKVNILHSRKTQDKEAILTVDGRKNIDLHSGDSLVVRVSNKKVKLMVKKDKFYNVCRKKLS